MARFVQFGSRILNVDEVCYIGRTDEGAVRVIMSYHRRLADGKGGSPPGLIDFHEEEAKRVWKYFVSMADTHDEFAGVEPPVDAEA
jgi:hypothetical protein